MAMEKRDKMGKALHIRGLRQRWMVNSVAPVCVLLILFSAGTAAFLSGWWGMGSMACFAAAGWIVYKPETHYSLWRFRLDDQGKPAPAGRFQLCSIVVLLIAAGFVLLFLGILKH